MSEFYDYEADLATWHEEEKRTRKWAWVLLAGVMVAVLIGATIGVLQTHSSGWEKEFRASIQKDIISEPDFKDMCVGVLMFDWDKDKIANMFLAQMSGEDRKRWAGREDDAAHITGEMITEACGA